MFSLLRLYAGAVLPDGRDYTFWGRGVSQGHSDAIRRVPGVADARQYTVPVPAAVESVRRGENPDLTTREKHTRECYVVLKPGADPAAVEKAIVEMPNYFADYDTTVHFVSQEELDRDHAGLPHGGFVLRSGATGENAEHKQLIEFALKLDSNPEFTASVLVAYARAVAKLAAEGQTGARSVFDVPPAYLSPRTGRGAAPHAAVSARRLPLCDGIVNAFLSQGGFFLFRFAKNFGGRGFLCRFAFSRLGQKSLPAGAPGSFPRRNFVCLQNRFFSASEWKTGAPGGFPGGCFKVVNRIAFLFPLCDNKARKSPVSRNIRAGPQKRGAASMKHPPPGAQAPGPGPEPAAGPFLPPDGVCGGGT